MPRLRTLALATALSTLAAALGCSDPSGPGKNGGNKPPPGPPVVSNLTCSGGQTGCKLELGDNTRFVVKLVSRSCAARNNVVRLTSPVAQSLTTDGCNEPIGKTWPFGPYAAGTVVDLEVVSSKLQKTPVLQLTGQSPVWTITFEDGGDDGVADFDDLVLQVTASP